MPRKRKKNFLIKIALWCWRHPHELLDRAMLALLAVILVMTLWPLGGFVAAGTGIAWGAWLVPLLLLLFGLWWFTADRPRHLVPWSLVFLPWLAYLAINWLFLSPAPWRAQLQFSLWAQAAAVFIVSCHVFRSKRDSIKLVSVLYITAFVAVVLGLYQYYVRPGWLPLGETQHPLFMESASGLFPTPAAFAGFLLLLFPLALAIAAMRRFSTPMRIGSGVLFALLLCGIIISASKWAWIVAALILAIAPFMLFDSIKPRVKFWLYSVILIGLTIGAVWVGNPVLRQRFQAALENTEAIGARENSRAAWALFLENPVTGGGAGATSYTVGAVQGEGAQAINALAHNGYAETLAQYGALGGLLLFIPVLCLFLAIWSSWRAQPSQKISSEAKFRQLHHNVHGAPQEPAQIRRRKRVRKGGSHRQDPAPLARILLAGILLGLLAFYIHFYFESHFAFVATIICLMVLLATAFSAARFRSRQLPQRVYGIVGFSLAFLSAGAIFSLSLPLATAQSYYFKASGQIAAVATDKPPMDEAVDQLSEAYDDLRFAVRLDPGHADAWAAMGEARVVQLEMAPFLSIDFMDEAVAHLQRAVEIQPGHWRYWMNLGRALNIYQAPADEVEAAFRRAVDLAPGSAQVWFHLGDFLSMDAMRRDEAMSAANRALELAPGFEPAQNLRQRLLLMGAR